MLANTSHLPRFLESSIKASMADITYDAASLPERLPAAILGLILIAAQSLELYLLFNPAFQASRDGIIKVVRLFMKSLRRMQQIAQDYRSYRYYVPWGRKRPILIESTEHIMELCDSKELSQRAVYSDIFGFKYTMDHREISMDPNEQTALRYRLYSRVLRHVGLSQIAVLQPYLQAKIDRVLATEIDSQEAVDGRANVKLAPLMRKLVTGSLTTFFFGEKMSQEPEFASALTTYYTDVIKCMIGLQLSPAVLASSVHSLISRNGRALKTLFARLKIAMNPAKDGWGEEPELRSVTVLHNMLEHTQGSSYWADPNAICQAIVGIWFAAAHQPWINLHFVFLELCARPDWVELLRAEIDAQVVLDYQTISTLPLLDAFIKESVRSNPLDRMSIRRKALQPFIFSNGGPTVQTGEIVCFPGWDVMHDKETYPRPDAFDPWRYVRPESREETSPMQGTTFTDASTDWPIWGLGSKVCPGRWHGALVMKMALASLLSRYEFRLDNAGAGQKWWWETFQMPFESTTVSFWERQR